MPKLKPVIAWAIVCKTAKEKEFDILGYGRLYIYESFDYGLKKAKEDISEYKGRKGYNYKIIKVKITPIK